MGTPPVTAAPRTARRLWTWLGVILLGLGLLGHLLAARAIGGTFVAYRDHILGFILLCVVSGAIIGGLGWRFWRGRHDITLLALGALQALLGFVVYVQMLRVHG
jgi:hypothetical protein